MAISIREVRAKLSADVKKTEEVSIHLRVSYSDKLETFKPTRILRREIP